MRSSYKTVWIRDLITPVIAQTPSVSNMVLKQFLLAYGKLYVFTDGIIQKARSDARKNLFGEAHNNVKYINGMKEALQQNGHYIYIEYTTCKETLKNIEKL